MPNGALDQPRTRRFRMALAEQLVVKAGGDLRAMVDELPYAHAPRTRASTATESEAYNQILNKLAPGRLTGAHLVDVWPVWRDHCEMRVKDPKHKMPQKWNCWLCFELTGKQLKTEFYCPRCNVTLHPGGCFAQYHAPEPQFKLSYVVGGLGNENKAREPGSAAKKN